MTDSEKLDLLDRQNRIIIQMIVNMNSELAAIKHLALHRWAISDVLQDEDYNGEDEFREQVTERFTILNDQYIAGCVDAKEAIIEAFQTSVSRGVVDELISSAFRTGKSK